jgi:hypothetical protein
VDPLCTCLQKSQGRNAAPRANVENNPVSNWTGPPKHLGEFLRLGKSQGSSARICVVVGAFDQFLRQRIASQPSDGGFHIR